MDNRLQVSDYQIFHLINNRKYPILLVFIVPGNESRGTANSLANAIRRRLNAETLSATAFPRDIRVAKAKRLVETIFNKIHFRAIDQRQRVLVDHDLYAVILEHDVLCFYALRIVNNVCEPIAASLFDAKPKTDAIATTLEIASDPLSSRRC